MNIQELHNRLIKRAGMADKLRKLIADLNKTRGNRKFVDNLEKTKRLPDTPDLLDVPNVRLDVPDVRLAAADDSLVFSPEFLAAAPELLKYK